MGRNRHFDIKTEHNSTYPKGGVSCSKDCFVVNHTLVFQIKFCGKSPALRVAANRYNPKHTHQQSDKKSKSQEICWDLEQQFIKLETFKKQLNGTQKHLKQNLISRRLIMSALTLMDTN